MSSRRAFLQAGLSAAMLAACPSACGAALHGEWVNDVHSQLNRTYVAGRIVARSERDVQDALRRGRPLSIAGARHAGGGQQFLGNGLMLDMTGMKRVVELDPLRGIVVVEAGIEWPALVKYLRESGGGWMIRKKQGIHGITLGGTLGANAHGNTLGMRPFIDDVEWFEMVDPHGEVRRCTRADELFGLVIGGYGLFGVVTKIALKLGPRWLLRAVVDTASADEIVDLLERRRAEGCMYGSAQTTIDPGSPDFLLRSIVTCYRPVIGGSVEQNALDISDKGWIDLITLAHAQPGAAFQVYADAYRASAGKIYHVDDVLMSGAYFPGYHRQVDTVVHASVPGSETLAEFYVPPEALATFLREMAKDFREHAVKLIFASIRMAERDVESFLPWAKRRYACVVLNLHTWHNPAGVEHIASAVRRLTSLAIAHGGSYYLTYGRWAERWQVEACYPQFREFLAKKKKYDPSERLQSDWYRWHRDLLG